MSTIVKLLDNIWTEIQAVKKWFEGKKTPLCIIGYIVCLIAERAFGIKIPAEVYTYLLAGAGIAFSAKVNRLIKTITAPSSSPTTSASRRVHRAL